MTNDERMILLTCLCSLTYGAPAETSPADEVKHHSKCPECGGWVDVRRLSEVLEHQAPGHETRPVH